jgi:DNA-binding response OmpR family regulator
VRLLVVDQSRLLAWQIRHDLPPELEVESVSSLAAAERIVNERPPDAIVVSVPLAQLPWREFHHRCAVRQPPIPILFESFQHADGEALGLDPGDGQALFVGKPAAREELRVALGELLSRASRARAARAV